MFVGARNNSANRSKLVATLSIYLYIGRVMTSYSKYAARIIATAACPLLITLSGCNNAQPSGDSAPPTTIGTVIDDSVTAAKVRSALLAEEDIKSLDIKVTIDKGVVMLSGFVDNQAQIDRGVAVATAVVGVKSIDNKLSIKEGRQSVGNKVDDSVITAGVKSALLADPDMKSLDVAVTTRKGEVELSGFVNNDTQLNRAVTVAKGVEGVTSVINHMSVKT
jgi:hyperosmotically inducible protein